MENSFLKKSSLALGLLLSISPLVQAEAPASALDDPTVLQKLLQMINKQAVAKSSPVVDSEALNDPEVMQKLLQVMAQQSAANQQQSLPVDTTEVMNDPAVMEKLLQTIKVSKQPEANAFEDPAMMAKLLGTMKTSETTASATTVATNALDDPSVMQGLLPLVAGTVVEQPAEIFEPVPHTLNFDDSLPEQLGMIGMSLTQQTSATFGDQLVFGGNLRYHLTDRFDALLNIELGMSSFGNPTIYNSDGSEAMKKNASFRTISTGIGYSLLNGIASTNGKTFIPWQLNLEGMVGEQFTGGSNGLYSSVGTSLHFMLDEYWLGTTTRYFYVDDSVLNKAGTHRGLQWGIEFGFYY
ncbi:hypothetical protein [Oceanobacter mangrovi]|uniref:hypothetical protein n=1 Tax=Oceanobacter mangrovi TaxID=2862510 RepID=UPI001C8D9399|nr:hypothetical protein [Oceanobacter mangrovi]